MKGCHKKESHKLSLVGVIGIGQKLQRQRHPEKIQKKTASESKAASHRNPEQSLTG